MHSLDAKFISKFGSHYQIRQPSQERDAIMEEQGSDPSINEQGLEQGRLCLVLPISTQRIYMAAGLSYSAVY